MHTINYVEMQGALWVTPHPVYANYGIAFDSSGETTSVKLVRGSIDGQTRLEIVENAPIPVLSWYYTTLETMLETVNTGSGSPFENIEKVIYSRP